MGFCLGDAMSNGTALRSLGVLFGENSGGCELSKGSIVASLAHLRPDSVEERVLSREEMMGRWRGCAVAQRPVLVEYELKCVGLEQASSPFRPRLRAHGRGACSTVDLYRTREAYRLMQKQTLSGLISLAQIHRAPHTVAYCSLRTGGPAWLD